MDALQCILTRRSCRSYEDRPIPKKEILELLTVGTKAATGSGMQPWGFVTLEGREKIAALSDEIKAWLKEDVYKRQILISRTLSISMPKTFKSSRLSILRSSLSR